MKLKLALAVAAGLLVAGLAQAEWKMAQGPLATRWAKDVTPENVHREYPRPQMVRKDWVNLNGLWDYAIVPQGDDKPAKFDGQILVPFPVESALSGVMKRVSPEQRLWYQRSVELPKGAEGNRVLLHFGAVDWETTVWVNGKRVGEHRGGYDPFTFDITEAIKPGQAQEIVLRVFDPSSAGTQPRGKQVLKPGGIWYTPTTGIWQTAWLEVVPKSYIESLRIVPDVDAGLVRVTVQAKDAAGAAVELEALADGKKVSAKSGKPGETIELPVESAKLWSPDSPFLYDLKVSLKQDGKAVDAVDSYFGMRKIALGKDANGVLRLMLNNKALFQYGPLDQGFWPDGLYTAPTDEALRYDIDITKRLGCNMARKHVKVEPARWYYWCDKLGLLVWQDMPSGDRHISGKDPDLDRTPASAEQFEKELNAMINAFYNYPSIVMWVPFNEGWGQFDTERIVKLVKDQDPSRLVNNTSGWTDRGVGDVNDVHRYPGPGMPPLEEKRAAVLGEFGGLGLPVKGHTWQDEKNWGYRSYKTPEELTEAYVALLGKLHPLIGEGLAAAVYTQTTDVEVEVNGLMTYDRAIIKMDEEAITKAAKRLHLPPPKINTVVPTAEKEPQAWKYTTQEPGKSWPQPDFNTADWKQGKSGFGKKDTPGAILSTEWTTADIWLRRTFTLDKADIAEPQLRVHHDEDAEVYINGVPAANLTGYTTGYTLAPISKEAATALKQGENVLAVHCHQTGGGQYIDVGLVDVIHQSDK